jgi:hypothetical protein
MSVLSVAVALGAGLTYALRAHAAIIPISSTTQLQQEVTNSNAGDTLSLAAMTYNPGATLNITHDLTIVGPTSGAGATITGGAVASPGFSGQNDTIDVEPGVTLTLEDVTITGGLSAASAEGALNVYGNLDLESSSASGNSNTVVFINIGATATIRNSTIANNTFSASVSAIDDAGDVHIFNSTIDHNDFGIFMDSGTAELTNTIVSHNLHGDCPAFGGPVTSSVKSFDTDGSCGLDLPSADPDFGPLTTNAGGSTLSLEPSLGPPKSPAIDAGTNSPCPGADQNGSPRNDGHCDIGAVEAQQGGGGDTTPPVVTVPADMIAEATGPSGAVVTFTATAQDNVDGAITPTCSPTSGSTFPVGSTTVTCSATDKAGNTGRASFHVTVQDTTPPQIAAHADVTAEATSATGAVVSYATPTATDAVDGTDSVTCAPSSGSIFPLGTSTVSCSSTDAHGNTGHSSFHVTVQDTTAPVLHGLPADITAEATSAAGATVTYATPTATDTVDPSPTVSCAPPSGSAFALGTTTVTCTATDASGNHSAASFHVTVHDTTAPVITVPGDITAEATSAGGAVVTYSATASDAVDPAPTLTCLPASGSQFGLGTSTVTCNASDATGNHSSKSFHVTVQDTTPPVLHGVPADITAEATSAAGATVTYTSPTATDTVDPSPTVSCSPTSGSTFPLATTTVTCTATDASGNHSSASFHVTVHDTTAPVIHGVPADITAEATSPAGAVVTYASPTATDAVDPNPTVSCTPLSGATFVLGTTTVACTASDASGNHSSASFHVTVHDTTAPVVHVPADITTPATGPSGAVVAYTVTSTDAVGVTNSSCTPATGSTFPIGTTTVSCSAMDAAGNTGMGSFRVTVTNASAPLISNVPADITSEATSSSGATVTYTNPTATDVVDGTDPVTCQPGSGTTFPLGMTTVDCSATDSASNTTHAFFHVTVQDTTPPAIAPQADLTAEATSAAGAAVNYTTPTATDAVDGTDAVSCSPTSGSTFPLGATTVHCSSTDAHGNTGHSSFTVTVQDTTPPAISASVDITVEATAPSTPVTFTTPTATDAVDGTDPVSCSPASGAGFPVGTTTVHCSSTDAHGNTGHSSFNVTVKDTTAPTIVVPADVTAEATGPGGAHVSYTVAFTDAVGVTSSGCAPDSGSLFGLGTTEVDCTASDAAGNARTASFHVTVVDTTPPSFSNVPADITTTAPTNAGVAVTYTNPTASDLVDGAVPVTCDSPSGSTFPIGATTVNCNATDSHGNTGHATFSVTVTMGFGTPPVIHGTPSDITAEATSSSGANVSYANPTATDSIDGTDPVDCAPGPGSIFPLGTTTVNCTASDSAGNSANTSFQVTIRDTTAPAIAATADITAEATSASGATVSYSTPSAADAVDGADPVTCSPSSGSTFPLGTTTVSCSSTDAHGNTGHSSFHVTVHDTTAPSIHGIPSDPTVEATSASGAAVAYTNPTATDAVDGTDAVTCTPAPGSTFPLGTTTVNCSTTDAGGNTSQASFHVKVQDTTPPAITVPADITAEAKGPTGAEVPYSVTFTDAVGLTSSDCEPPSGSTFALGTTTVQCTAADAAGNTSQASFHVTVTDTTPPVISGTPSDMTAEATSPSGAPVNYTTPTATDLVDGTDAVSCTPSSGATFPLGTTTVTCTATDAHHNSSNTSFKVKVVDTTPPVVTVPADKVVVSTTPTGVTYTATASDLVSGTLTPTCTPASGSTFPLGPTIVTCHAADAAGNIGTASFTVTVALDQASGNASASGTVSTGNTPTPANPLETSVTTPNAGPVTIVEEAATGTPPAGFAFLGYEAVITAPAATAASPLTLEFVIDPSLMPAGAVSTNLIVWRNGVVVPACSGAGATPDPCIASRNPFPLPSGGGADIVVRTSHASLWNFGSSLTAPAPPVVTVPADIVVEIKGRPRTVVNFTATAVDYLGHPLTPTCVPPSGSVFPLGTTTVTCTATDSHGASSSASFKVTVVRRHKAECDPGWGSPLVFGKPHSDCEGDDDGDRDGPAHSPHRDR